MQQITSECKPKASVFNDMRAFIALDLTRNELKVLMTYRLEMDEATRQVRGKDQEALRALCGLSKTQFSLASASLQRRGLIEASRTRNAAQIVTVNAPESGHQETPETGNTETRTFEIRNPGISKSGTPETRCDDIYTAPVSAPVSAPNARESENDRIWASATKRGDALKGGKVAKSNRAAVRTKGELDGATGIKLQNGELTLSPELADKLRSEFKGIDVAAVCDRAARHIIKISYPTHDAAWAEIRNAARNERQFGTSKQPEVAMKSAVTSILERLRTEELAHAAN